MFILPLRRIGGTFLGFTVDVESSGSNLRPKRWGGTYPTEDRGSERSNR